MASALADLRSLPNPLRRAIHTLGGDPLKEYMCTLEGQLNLIGSPEVKNWDNPKLRKLHFVQDKEGKSRPIAIFDY